MSNQLKSNELKEENAPTTNNDLLDDEEAMLEDSVQVQCRLIVTMLARIKELKAQLRKCIEQKEKKKRDESQT